MLFGYTLGKQWGNWVYHVRPVPNAHTSVVSQYRMLPGIMRLTDICHTHTCHTVESAIIEHISTTVERLQVQFLSDPIPISSQYSSPRT